MHCATPLEVSHMANKCPSSVQDVVICVEHVGRGDVQSARKRARPIVSRSQMVGTGLKTVDLVLMETVLLMEEERETGEWLLRNPPSSSTRSARADSFTPALVAGDGKVLFFGERGSVFS